MRDKSFLAALVVAALLLALASSASAFKEICAPGSGAEQCDNPQGLAVDNGAKRLYVADTGHNRINVFNAETGAFIKSFGSSGSGKGQFSGPTDVAIDPSTHDVYVVDYGNRRVEMFTEEGAFLLMFGGGVNQTTSGDVCTAASGDTCGPGSNEFGEWGGSEFSGAAIPVAVGPAGVVYVADSKFKNGVDEGEGFESRIQRFEPSGAPIAECELGMGKMADMAVDSAGFVYVRTHHVGEGFRKYDPSCSVVFEFEPTFTSALAVDPLDHIFAAQGTQGIRLNIVEYDSSTPPVGIRRFGYGFIQSGLNGLAPFPAAANGDVYASEGDRVIALDFGEGPIVLPEPFPEPCKPSVPIGNTKVTLNAEINPEAKATTFHFEYITDEDFIANGNSFTGLNPATSTPETPLAGPVDIELHKASAADVAVVPETKYHCRVVAENADGEDTGPEGIFETPPPVEFGPAWALDVTSNSASLNTQLNPQGIATTGFFEYISDEDFIANGNSFEGPNPATATSPEMDFGAGIEFETGSTQLAGLSPGTLYHYRVVAVDSFFPDGILDPEEPERSFRTYPTAPTGIPDDRKYELVSPAQKNSAEVAVPGLAGGLFDETSVRIEAAAGSGEAITYTSWTSFGEGEGAPSTSQYLSKRGAGGWGTENISPFGFLKNPLRPPYRGFNPDLTLGAFVTSEPPLSEDCEGIENLYLREESGELRCLTTAAPLSNPAEVSFSCTGFAGAGADGSRAFFAANARLTPEAPEGKGFQLYEWSAADGLALASILNGEPELPAPPSPQTAFGAQGDSCGMGEKRPAVSADGSVAFWTFVPASGASRLLARINGEKTIRLDLKEGVSGIPTSGGVFQASSSDGSVAFFTASSRLKSNSSATGTDLYRYQLNAPEGEHLTDLTPAGSGSANVQGVIGASDDGTYLYFVASGVLSGEEENGAGQKAAAGKPNLYLWHQGDPGVRFLATLSGEDSLDWSLAPRSQSARVSADGLHLAFTSIAAEELVGYDNTIAAGKACQPIPLSEEFGGSPLCPQAFVYGADTDELRCASCNPSGSRPLGPSELPTASNPYEGPRYLAEDGSRLFFESRDALLPEDENQKRDVYEFELLGKGSCSSQSPSFNPLSGGCVYLISTAKSEDHSYLLDASADGRDVFLATRQQMVGWDSNENYDVYDFRVGGGFPEPVIPPPPCTGEGCKSPPTSPPPAANPATPGFIGPGNVKPKKQKQKKAKGKKKGKGKKHKAGAKKHRKQGGKR
jgi:hypothetical protein